MEEKIIKKLKQFFFICILVMCIASVLLYCFVPYIGNSIDYDTKYVIQILCSIIPMAMTIIVTIRVPSIVLRSVKEKRLMAYHRWNIAAMVLFTLAFILNVFVKCSIDYVGAYYCAIICILMFVLLLYPKHEKLVEFLNKESKENKR